MWVPHISYASLEVDQVQVQGRFGRMSRLMGKIFNRSSGRSRPVSSDNAQPGSQNNPTVSNNSSSNSLANQSMQSPARAGNSWNTQDTARVSTAVVVQRAQSIQAAQPIQTSKLSFQATSVEAKHNTLVFQSPNESRPPIPQISAESKQDGGGGAFGRNTMKATETAREGETPAPEAGEAIWFEKEQEEEITLEVLLKATGKLMTVAGLGEHVLERFDLYSGMGLKFLSTFKKLLAFNEPISSSKSFEDQMGEKLVNRILGTEGPAPSLLAILGPEAVGMGVKFGVGAIPIPGMQIAGNIAGNMVAKGMSHLMKVQLPYGTAYSVVQAAYLSKTVATSFHQVYAPILEKLTLQEQQDLITHAVNTAMFHVDQTVLRGEEGVTITPQTVMRSIGTEFMNLDARMPRAGLLVRKFKSLFVEQSGLKTYEARALLTSTPVRIGENSYRPIKQDDPRRLFNEVLVERLLWRGVIKRKPISIPNRFKDFSRAGDLGYGRLMGLVPPEPVESVGENAAAAA